MEYIRTVYYAFLLIYTYGSRNPVIGRTGSAFYVPEFKIRKHGRIMDGPSVYTVCRNGQLRCKHLDLITELNIPVCRFTSHVLH